MANFTSFVEPNLWELARVYGGQATIVYCAQLFERTGTSELIARAAREPYSPGLAAELAEARRFFVGRGCADYVKIIDSYVSILAQRAAQAAAAAATPRHGPLGKRVPVGPSVAAGAPGSAEHIRALLAYEVAHGNRPTFVRVFENRLADIDAWKVLNDPTADASSLLTELLNAQKRSASPSLIEALRVRVEAMLARDRASGGVVAPNVSGYGRRGW